MTKRKRKRDRHHYIAMDPVLLLMVGVEIDRLEIRLYELDPLWLAGRGRAPGQLSTALRDQMEFCRDD